MSLLFHNDDSVEADTTTFTVSVDELNRCGTSWDDDEDNAFFEKSVKIETQQAVVKVMEHGNVEKLVLEVSACVCVCLCIIYTLVVG